MSQVAEMFCECGGLWTTKRTKEGRVMVCNNCGNTRPLTNLHMRFQAKNTENMQTVVIEQDRSDEQMPEITITCPKCGYTRAKYWTDVLQTDEYDETTFYRCMKCKYIWKED